MTLVQDNQGDGIQRSLGRIEGLIQGVTSRIEANAVRLLNIEAIQKELTSEIATLKENLRTIENRMETSNSMNRKQQVIPYAITTGGGFTTGSALVAIIFKLLGFW